jgi:quinohemoprotein amine dehydrogenase alpha subunit
VAALVLGLQASALGGTPFGESTVVRQKCTACHKLDEKGRVDVIEETRKTPEEWINVVDRMVRLNGAVVGDAEFHPVIKELSRHLCLTPGEMAAVAYINSDENSQYREIPANDQEKRIFQACVRCHTYGKMASHRMTPAQWADIRNLHLGYYPTVIGQMREMNWQIESKELSEIIAKMFPMDTPEWQAWMKSRKNPDLSGKWVVAGYQPGLGTYGGTVAIAADASRGEDEYTLEREIHYDNGITLKMTGTGTLYGTYHLKTAMTSSVTRRMEGVFDLNPETSIFEGKWWNVVQDTNSYGNERFARVGGAPAILAVFPSSMKKAPGTQHTVTVVGANLPQGLKEGDLQFADANVKVRKIEKNEGSRLVCKVEVGKDAAVGPCALTIKGTAGGSVVVYEKVDGIRVFPAIGRARVSSGPAYPPQGVQFVARAVSKGKDGMVGTADDLILEPMNAGWTLEEAPTRDNDDDLKYLQAPVPNGLYTPFTTYGPIESRFQRREGTGHIAIVATVTEGGQELKDRAQLVVTVPDFITHIK